MVSDTFDMAAYYVSEPILSVRKTHSYAPNSVFYFWNLCLDPYRIHTTSPCLSWRGSLASWFSPRSLSSLSVAWYSSCLPLGPKATGLSAPSWSDSDQNLFHTSLRQLSARQRVPRLTRRGHHRIHNLRPVPLLRASPQRWRKNEEPFNQIFQKPQALSHVPSLQGWHQRVRRQLQILGCYFWNLVTH